MHAALGVWLDRRGRPWFARPTFIAGAVAMIAALDLFAIDGKMLHAAGITLRALQPTDVDDSTLIDMLAGLSLNGVIFYLVAAALEKRGTEPMRPTATLLAAIAPFSMLEPLAWLCHTQSYFARYDWLYLGLALLIAALSYRRQRRSFYYAGIANAGFGLYLITVRQEWFDKPLWGIAILGIGVAMLALGFAMARRRAGPSGTSGAPGTLGKSGERSL
jgi:hypothetical protein